VNHFLLEKTFAWSVHIFTACGLLAGFMAIIAVNAGNWRAAMLWLLAALVIDGIDGTFARLFKTKEVLPRIDGKTIDYVVDFVNYAFVPAYFFYVAGLVAAPWNLPLAFLILLVSAIYYGREGMVSDDFYFIGFPVMWNVVVFYLVFVFSFGSPLNALIVAALAVLHFVPVKFAYPSRAIRLRVPTLVFTAILLLAMPPIVWFYPYAPFWLKGIAVLSLVYFGGLAAFDTFKKR
jgi:phosphatidylcholine synthase